MVRQLKGDSLGVGKERVQSHFLQKKGKGLKEITYARGGKVKTNVELRLQT